MSRNLKFVKFQGDFFEDSGFPPHPPFPAARCCLAHVSQFDQDQHHTVFSCVLLHISVLSKDNSTTVRSSVRPTQEGSGGGEGGRWVYTFMSSMLEVRFFRCSMTSRLSWVSTKRCSLGRFSRASTAAEYPGEGTHASRFRVLTLRNRLLRSPGRSKPVTLSEVTCESTSTSHAFDTCPR